MKKQSSKIIIIMIIIGALIQSIAISYIQAKNKNIKLESEKEITKIKKHKTLNEFNDKLKTINGIKILEANQINEKWYIKVVLEGEKNKILESLSYLNDFDINDYKIEHNKDKSSLIIELTDYNI